MGAYTARLKDVLTENGGSYRMEDGVWIIDKPELIGLAHYPIFDEGYRNRLNGAIFGQYMNREIAHETDSIFRNRVNQHMMLHMPIFNKMYNADLLEIKPLLTAYSKTRAVGSSGTKTDSTGESHGQNTGTGTSRAVTSDTPQSMLKGNGDYASGAADSRSDTKSDAKSTEKGSVLAQLDSVQENEYEGYNGQAIQLIEAYKAALTSVDATIINGLEQFFMMLYIGTDTFTDGNTRNAYAF